MILTCENCHTRYLVPVGAIGPEGRDVRCASCHHQWFQEPEEIAHHEAYYEEADVEPIPESVHPVPEGSSLPVIMGDDGSARASSGRAAGYMAAAAVFLLVFAGLVAGRARIVHVWLPSMRLYEALRIAPALPGQGLALDQASAVVTPNAQGVNVLTIRGSLSNPTGQTMKIPPLQASIQFDDGKIFDSWRIDPPQPGIAPGGKTDFQSRYPAVPNNAKEVKINLLLVH